MHTIRRARRRHSRWPQEGPYLAVASVIHEKADGSAAMRKFGCLPVQTGLNELWETRTRTRTRAGGKGLGLGSAAGGSRLVL